MHFIHSTTEGIELKTIRFQACSLAIELSGKPYNCILVFLNNISSELITTLEERVQFQLLLDYKITKFLFYLQKFVFFSNLHEKIIFIELNKKFFIW